MTIMIFTLRCPHCKRSGHYTGTLEGARRQICSPCSLHTRYQVRFTVVGHENVPQEKPPEAYDPDQPKVVTQPPDGGKPYWRITPKQETEARRLVDAALSGKEEISG